MHCIIFPIFSNVPFIFFTFLKVPFNDSLPTVDAEQDGDPCLQCVATLKISSEKIPHPLESQPLLILFLRKFELSFFL